MTVSFTEVRYPVAPTLTKRRGTLLDSVQVTPGIEFLDGNDLFESYNCLTFDAVTGGWCAPAAKDLSDVAGWVNGFRTAVYGGVTCKSVGGDMVKRKAEVERVFSMGESTGVERALMANRFKIGPDLDPGAPVVNAWPAPVDITPAAGAVKPTVGLGLLEGYGANNYAGAPTLHVPVAVASLALGINGAVWDGDTLRSQLGSPIVAGAGYDYPNLGPTGAAAAVGEKWLYVTGSVVINAGDLIVRDALDQYKNDHVTLAERGYVIAVDCFAAAVRVGMNT
jgi:hypothetical protein